MTAMRFTLVALALSLVALSLSLAALFGVWDGDGGAKGRAESFAQAEFSVLPLSSSVECREVQKVGSGRRFACSADTSSGGQTTRATIIVQCVDGADACTRVS